MKRDSHVEDFSRRSARRSLAELLRRVYEVDPLACPHCGGEMRIVAFIQTPKVIDRILRHLREKRCTGRTRGKATARQLARVIVSTGHLAAARSGPPAPPHADARQC